MESSTKRPGRRPRGRKRRKLEEALGHAFGDPRLLERALSHRSWAHENPGEADYERLEFLGDALLGFLVSDALYRVGDASDEGTLTRRRQRLVSTEALARAAARLDLGTALRLGHGEESSGGRVKPSLLADVFEAVLAAVYLDGGLRAARAFVRRHLDAGRAAVEDGPDGDYKTRLQERIQAELRVTPVYRIVTTRGPSHAVEFEAVAVIDGDVAGRGWGSSRKRAEQAAAAAALKRWERGERDARQG